MTTTVIVKANHGWPVRVTPLSSNGCEVDGPRTVEPATEQSFVFFDGRDLLIREVQPGYELASCDEPILKFTARLRKLLEARDCAERAALEG